MRRLTLLTLWGLLTLGIAPFIGGETRPVAAGGRVCFDETGFCAENAFLDFWRSHGSTEILGLPVTQPFVDDRGLIVQYYERAIMEFHPENGAEYQVLLTLLGDARLGDRPERGAPAAECASSCTLFADTGHTLRGTFLNYWTTNGGLPVFGFPLTEEFQEVNPSNGEVYTVQYFERNRFEYHPENAGTRFEVLLGLLGAETLRGREGVLGLPAAAVPDYPVAAAPAPVTPAPPSVAPAAALPSRLVIPSIGVDAAIEYVGLDANGAMDVPKDYFNTAWYEPGTRPGQPGNAVISGHVDSAALNRRVVFGDLERMVPGNEVIVVGDDGSQRRFIVQSVETYRTADAPLARIFGPTTDVNLNLISCIGTFDQSVRSYDQRIVVYARWDGASR